MPTLSTALISQKTLAAFRVGFPMIEFMGTDFSDKPLRLNDSVTAHILTLPLISTYDVTTGYANGAQEGRGLMVDIPITVDNHKHVPLKFSHLNLIKDQKPLEFDTMIQDTAFVLGRAMIDSVLAKVKGSTFSRQVVAAAANVDLDELTQICGAMNTAGASPSGRIGLISTGVANALDLDPRVTSKDYYGQLTGGSSYRVYRNIAGFQALYEYPNLPTNNAAGATFTAATTDVITSAAHGYLAGDKVRFTTTTTLPAGLSLATTYYVRDVTTNTFKVSATDGGAAVDITDTGTGVHTVTGYENLIGFFFTREAIALRAGIPEQTAEAAAALGINQVMAMEVMADPVSKFMLALMKWQQAGTGDLFVSPTALWGSALGRQSGAADAITDKGGFRLVSAG